MYQKLLYVCYNNKGRSPALEAFTKYFLERQGKKGIIVESAGVGVESIKSLRKKSCQISKITRRIMHHDYGLDLDHTMIRHLGEVGDHWDAVLAVDRDIVEFIAEDFPGFYPKTMLAKEFAGYSHSHNIEIHGPYHYQNEYRANDWSERLGYNIMLNECKNVSRRIAKKFEN